jgi:hypothetical protein
MNALEMDIWYNECLRIADEVGRGGCDVTRFA